jgi:hypothetical protein
LLVSLLIWLIRCLPVLLLQSHNALLGVTCHVPPQTLLLHMSPFDKFIIPFMHVNLALAPPICHFLGVTTTCQMRKLKTAPPNKTPDAVAVKAYNNLFHSPLSSVQRKAIHTLFTAASQ